MRSADFPGAAGDAVLAWLMSAYSFRRYLTDEPRKIRKLVLPERRGPQGRVAQGAGDLVRARVDQSSRERSRARPISRPRSKASAKPTRPRSPSFKGDALLDKNFPLVHAVGRASSREPCLASLVWGDKKHPKVTLVGKGICFDTGGLDIKPSQAMALMKKDMGGAATAMALGAMIMAAKLPVRLAHSRPGGG